MVLVMFMTKSKDTLQRLRSLPTSKSNTKLDQVTKYHNFFEKNVNWQNPSDKIIPNLGLHDFFLSYKAK